MGPEAPAPSAEDPRQSGHRSCSLTAGIARGDQSSFAEFYELWFDRAYALARSITRRDESFCLDIVQDCMMKVVRAMRPLKTEAAVQAWMAKAVFRTSVDHLRRESRRRRHEDRAARPFEALSGEAASNELEQRERLAWVKNLIAELPEQDRRLILRRFFAGMTLATVGEECGIGGDVAHGRIRRILARWRQAAKEYYS